MLILKLDKKIELSYPEDFGYGTFTKSDKAEFVNKYLFNFLEFENIQKQINVLKKENIFVCETLLTKNFLMLISWLIITTEKIQQNTLNIFELN